MPERIDGRGLEPPRPFELVMEALVRLPAGDRITLILDRVPWPLFEVLERDGYRYEYRQCGDGAVEVTISAP